VGVRQERETKQFRSQEYKVMRSKSIIAGLMICISLAATANAQNDGRGRQPASSGIKNNRASFDLFRIDEDVVKEFRKAWRCSVGGTSRREGAVLIFRRIDGSYMARSQGCSNQSGEFTFTWHSNAIAIVHTHPNDDDARPAPQDEQVADRYRVPVFTITSRGMFMYDPAAGKTSKVMERLDWLEAGNFQSGEETSVVALVRERKSPPSPR
jgi:hypothetical protein